MIQSRRAAGFFLLAQEFKLLSMRFLSFFLIFLFLYACAENSSTPVMPQDSVVQDGTLMSDTQMVPTDTISQAVAPKGIYTVTITTKGAKPIEQTVAFLSGRSYRMEEHTQGNTTSIEKTSGTWAVSNGTIWLYKDQVVKARYLWKEDTLLYLHPAGSTTRMEKRVAATDNDVWRRKGAEGLEFYGVGNEPFWNIDIDEQKSIRFQLADWEKPLEFKAVAPASIKDGLTYATGSDTSRLQVTIYNSFCSDGMSDFIYNNRVVVRYKGAVYNGCGILFRR
jgi:uncharacterized membrane protein